MGLIQLPQKKRIRIKLANTQRLRDARAKHQEWLKKHGLDNIKPRDRTGDLVLTKIEDRTGIPCGNRPPIAVKGRQEPQQYSGLTR